jgi:hypothetical protein
MGWITMNYLDRLFCEIERRYADTIEWTTLDRLATSLSASSATPLIEKTAAKAVAYRAA